MCSASATRHDCRASAAAAGAHSQSAATRCRRARPRQRPPERARTEPHSLPPRTRCTYRRARVRQPPPPPHTADTATMAATSKRWGAGPPSVDDFDELVFDFEPFIADILPPMSITGISRKSPAEASNAPPSRPRRACPTKN